MRCTVGWMEWIWVPEADGVHGTLTIAEVPADGVPQSSASHSTSLLIHSPTPTPRSLPRDIDTCHA